MTKFMATVTRCQDDHVNVLANWTASNIDGKPVGLLNDQLMAP